MEKCENFSNIPVGTIILAKRYKTEEQLKEIPKGHEIGPFVVIEKKEKDWLLFGVRVKEKISF